MQSKELTSRTIPLRVSLFFLLVVAFPLNAGEPPAPSPFADQEPRTNQLFLYPSLERGEDKDKGTDTDAPMPKGAEGDEKETSKEPSDLTLSNLFTEGWNEKLEERSKTGRAARIHLFRTRRPFFDREFRLNYDFVNNSDGGLADEHEIEPEIEVPFNRRFLMEVEGNYTWIDFEHEPDRDGPTFGISSWLQLVDTYDSALNVQLRLDAPPKGELGDGRTNLGLVLAGFRDLGDRIGLQADVENDFLMGASNPGAPHEELAYTVALTKTLTEKTPYLEYFTVFTEAFGSTQLDGDHAGRTTFSILPGVRWEIKKDWWFATGVEVPITGPHPYDETFHFAIIKEID